MLLISFKILIFYSGAIIVDAKSSICGDIHLVKEKGIIRSPNYPHPYPNSTNCTWTILSPPYSILTLVIKDVDIGDDQDCMARPCCTRNSLTLPAVENELVYRICGHNMTVKPIQLSQLETKISFQVSSNKHSRGFLLSYFIEPFHTESCPPSQTKCGENSDHCFTYSSERCDGIPHCPDGEDELGCALEKNNDENNGHVIKSSNKDKCAYQTFWCEGNYACNLKSEQEACLKNSVVSATIMGCLFCALLLVIAMMCGLRMYTMHSESNGNYRIHFPPHIASRLSLSRYISLPELIDDDFFHREPPPSYSIAVGQSNGNSETLSSHGGRRGRSWRQLPQIPSAKPPTPPPSTETSNQSSPSRDSITSSSYLSNDDNIQLVNTEN